MLTVKEAMMFWTRQAMPPWRAGELKAKLGVDKLSLRVVLQGVSEARVAILMDVRDPEILSGVQSLAELRQAWKASRPSDETLKLTRDALNGAGIDIVYSAPFGQQIAVRGALNEINQIRWVKVDEQLFSASALTLETEDFGSPFDHITSGLVHGAEGVVAIAVLTEFSWIVFIGALVFSGVGGAEFGVGLAQLFPYTPNPAPEADVQIGAIGEITNVRIPDVCPFGPAPMGGDWTGVDEWGALNDIHIGEDPEKDEPPSMLTPE
jgi:hypothetical protein